MKDYFTQVMNNFLKSKESNFESSEVESKKKTYIPRLRRIKKPPLNSSAVLKNQHFLIEQSNNSQNRVLSGRSFLSNEFTSKENYKDDAKNLQNLEHQIKNLDENIIDSTISTPFDITSSLELALSSTTEAANSSIKNVIDRVSYLKFNLIV